MARTMMELLTDLDEGPFLQDLHAHPEDDTVRLIYADFLEERGDPRGEFLHLEAILAAGVPAPFRHQVLLTRFQELRAGIDAAWLQLVLKHSRILNCGSGADEAPALRFTFECPNKWETLRPGGEDKAIRFCDACRRSVFFCRTATEVRKRARLGQCVAIGVDLARRVNQHYSEGITGQPLPFESWGRDLFGPENGGTDLPE